MNVGVNQTGVDAAALNAVENPEEDQSTALILKPAFDLDTPQESLGDQIQTPILQIVHAVGGLSKMFTPGDMVLGKTDVVVPKGQSIRMIVVRYQRYYKEYISIDRWNRGDRDAKVFSTAAEAIAAGFTVEYNRATGQKATAPACLLWAMLLEKPEGLQSELFYRELNGKMYAPARMYVERTAFYAVSDTFSRAATFSHKPVKEGGRGIYTAVWELKISTFKAKSGNESWVPNIKLVASLSDAEAQALKTAMHV